MSKRRKHTMADNRALSLFNETGQHCLLTGATGSGKTTLLYWLIKRFLDETRNECIIFRDTSKPSESLYLSNFKPLRYLVPEGCDISLPNNAIDFEVCNFNSYDELFSHIKKDKINIISVWRFLSWDDDLQTTDFWAYFFKELVRRAFDYELENPTCLVLDELSQITPSSPSHRNQTRLCRYVARCVEQLRGVDVRILGTSQGWTKLFKSVRISFQYYIFKRVAERVDVDIPILKTTTNKIQSLRPDQYIILTPEKHYSNPYGGIPDLEISSFSKDCKLRYVGDLSGDWRCSSELRPPENNTTHRGSNNNREYLLRAAKGFRDRGYKVTEIAKIFGCTPKHVYTLLRELKEEIDPIGKQIDDMIDKVS